MLSIVIHDNVQVVLLLYLPSWDIHKLSLAMNFPCTTNFFCAFTILHGDECTCEDVFWSNFQKCFKVETH